MACLPSRFLAALLAQSPRLSGIPIAGWRFTAVVAVFGHTSFQLVHTRAQRFHLLLQAVVFRSQLRILLSKLPILSLKLFDDFFLTHDSILIVHVKGAV